MKTIALTLFIAALGCAQNKPPSGIAPVPNARPKTAPPADGTNNPPAGTAPAPKSVAPVVKNKPPTGITTLPPGNTRTAPAAHSTQRAQPSKAAPAKASSAKTAPKPAADQKAKAQSVTIPTGAKQVEPNLYRYTDSSGKTWNYRQTPFGVSRWEETSSPSTEAVPQPAPHSDQAKADPVAVTDLGDSYRFEKKTPFGHSSWTRKKSDLNDEEKALASGMNSKVAGNQ